MPPSSLRPRNSEAQRCGHLAGAVAKCDQLLAEQHQADRRAVAFEFGGFERRHPVFTHELAHCGAGADLGEFRAFGCGRHSRLLMPAKHTPAEIAVQPRPWLNSMR
jgi:hypothetical protein